MHTVLAAGAGVTGLLDEDLAQEVAVPPLLSGRGVSVVVYAPFDLPAVRSPNRGFACGSHMVPRTDGRVYLGATNRLSTEPDYSRRATLDELATLMHDATAELNTTLRDAELLDVRVGHRPVTLDHLPLVGRTGQPTVHLATGTYRCGVLLAPHAATIVADGITAPGSTRRASLQFTPPHAGAHAARADRHLDARSGGNVVPAWRQSPGRIGGLAGTLPRCRVVRDRCGHVASCGDGSPFVGTRADGRVPAAVTRRRRPDPMNPELDLARSVLAQISGRAAHALTADDRLAPLGLDSLGRLTLAVLLEERTGRPLSDEALLKVRTVSDLERLLRPDRNPA